MSFTFDREKGPAGDLAEIEYISALHQSGAVIRPDGSINASDIKYLLMSRHGIVVTEQEVEKRILKGLGMLGGRSVNEKPKSIDIPEIMTNLIIPFLRKLSVVPNKKDNPLILKKRDDFTWFWQYSRHEKNVEKLRKAEPDDRNIIKDILATILIETTGSKEYPELNSALLKKILQTFGEYKADEHFHAFIENMLKAAGVSEDETLVLDEALFLKALTYDINLCDPYPEANSSSHFVDVFNSDDLSIVRRSFALEKDVEKCAKVHAVDLRFTASSIDFQIDSNRSRILSTLLWTNFAVTYMAYYFRITSAPLWDCNHQDANFFWCVFAQYLLNWVSQMLLFSIVGTIYVGFGSAANGLQNESFIHTIFYSIIAIGTVSFFNIVSFYTEMNFYYFSTIKRPELFYKTLYNLQLLLGFIIIFFQICRMFNLVNENIYSECLTKEACSFKVKKMINNAHKFHQPFRTSLNKNDSKKGLIGKIIMQVVEEEGLKERVGGIIWTFREIINGKLFSEEGIWFSGRIVTCFYVILLALLNVAILAEYVIETYAPPKDGNTELKNYQMLMAALGMTPNIDANPSKDYYQFMTATCLGAIIGCANCIIVAIILLPSTTSTMLKYRSGVHPSLKDPERFPVLRSGVEYISLVFPSQFWGVMSSSMIFFTLVTLAVLLISKTWQNTIAQSLWAQVIAITVTCVIAIVAFMIIGAKLFRSFFRTAPWASNSVILIVQSWYVGISIMFAVIRVCKLLLVAFVAAGRIDVPVLSPESESIFGWRVDTLPNMLRQDLLIHETHRHPYLERLGLLYMMKLRHRENFCTKAGNSWRLIFILALMPWLRKHRIIDRSISTEEDIVIGEESDYTHSEKTCETAPDLDMINDGGETTSEEKKVSEEESEYISLLESMPSMKNKDLLSSDVQQGSDAIISGDDEDLQTLQNELFWIQKQIELLEQRREDVNSRIASAEKLRLLQNSNVGEDGAPLEQVTLLYDFEDSVRIS